MSKGRIDLHCHTTASDGTFAPSELVDEAFKRGLAAIAVTDHDSVEGVCEATDEGKRTGVEVVPGIELSTEHMERDVHILGYYVDVNDRHLLEFLESQREDRLVRAEKIVANLGQLGAPIEFERVLELSNGGAVGRPHIARALVEAKYASSWTDAFNRFIGKRCPAYVERSRLLTPSEAIELVRMSKGVAVLAHPGHSKIDDLISELIEAGLGGIECIYPDHTQAQELFYRKTAMENGLVITAGSDCHGPDSKSGVVLGKCTTDYEVLKMLRDKCAGR